MAGCTSGRYVSRQTCPHCAGPLKIKTQKKITPTFLEVYFYCDGDPECGWRGVASMNFERTITESGRPNPAVRLKASAPRRSPAGRTDAPADVAFLAAPSALAAAGERSQA